MNFKEWRENISSRMKLKQILEAFQDVLDPGIKKYVCAPCSNCKGAIRDVLASHDLWEKHGIYYGGIVELVANALSDVYAMGGTPLTGMNLVAFPIKALSSSILKEILRGGLSKMEEADVALVGGHTIEDPEIKYGLAVTGIVQPNKILTNAKAEPGDRLVLTKPLGTGIIATALKGGMASAGAVQKMVESMVLLNRRPSERMKVFGAHACTDITGFGFIGHAMEMAWQARWGW
jgi:selenium donor protein